MSKNPVLAAQVWSLKVGLENKLGNLEAPLPFPWRQIHGYRMRNSAHTPNLSSPGMTRRMMTFEKRQEPGGHMDRKTLWTCWNFD
jgi:hypothetical protein